MTPTFKTTRICAGEYEVTDGTGRVVQISCNEYWDGPGWAASAGWDRTRYSDPLSTKREAVQVAHRMLTVDLT